MEDTNMWRWALAVVIGCSLICVCFSSDLVAAKKSKPDPKAEKEVKVEKKEGEAESKSETKKVLKIKLKSKKRVYYGDVGHVTEKDAIRVIMVRTVFANNKYYRRIKTDKIPHGSARYWIYLARANKAFKGAVKSVATKMKLQLVVEKYNIKTIDNKPLLKKEEEKMDVTKVIVKAVRGSSRA